MAKDCSRAADWKAEHACARAKFLTRAALQPPPVLRVIDIEATSCRQAGERVVLIDYLADAAVQEVGYTAISHTYGMPVYEAFDCRCASHCYASVPRCSEKLVCPHQDDASSEQQKRVVNDILRMCDILRTTGVQYAWHDGVCIAQHDEAEVEETIKHMGWIYAYAKETVIFLHYVGNPMAPISNGNYVDELCCRWHTRVWTLQEGALSKCRRYCVRVGSLGESWQSLEEFEEKIALSYGDRDDSSTIEIMEEERFFEFLKQINRVLCSLSVEVAEKALAIPDAADEDVIFESNWMWTKAITWSQCTSDLLDTLLKTCFVFPTMETALLLCSARDSKHRGDKMNSILALAEVKDFVAPKDGLVEASTIEFFKRQGQVGLAAAVFSINFGMGVKENEYLSGEREHTWPPVLWSNVRVISFRRPDAGDVEVEGGGVADIAGMGYKVLEDGRMELRGEMTCVMVQFTVKEHQNCVKESEGVYIATEEVVLANNDVVSYYCFDMDLTQSDLYVFKASISGSHITAGEVYFSAIERCCNGQHINEGPAPVVMASKIKEGDIFRAYVVIPKRIRYSLLVQGGLDAHVSKVGIFVPTPNFLEIVARLDPAPATLEKLIVI